MLLFTQTDQSVERYIGQLKVASNWNHMR